jgi:hypothetical protein
MAKYFNAQITNPGIVQQVKESANAMTQINTVDGLVQFRYGRSGDEVGCFAVDLTETQAIHLSQIPGFKVEGYDEAQVGKQSVDDHDAENKRLKEIRDRGENISETRDQQERLLKILADKLGYAGAPVPALSRKELAAAELDNVAIDAILNLTARKGADVTPATPLPKLYFEAAKIAANDPAFTNMLREIIDESDLRKELAELEDGELGDGELGDGDTELLDGLKLKSEDVVIVSELRWDGLTKLAKELGVKTVGVAKEIVIAAVEEAIQKAGKDTVATESTL